LSDRKLKPLPPEPVRHQDSAIARGVVVAPSIPLAVFRAIYADVNARMQMQAMAAGGPIEFLDLEEAKQASKVVDDQTHTRAWDLWCRALPQCG
jgi:hypothetical protein